MKIILREHVEHLGEPGEVVTVAPGYARNYLLPKGLAMTATPGNLHQVESQRKVWEAKELKEVGAAEEVAARLAAIELTVPMKAGESGTLYGSVTTSDIAELLAKQGLEIDRKRLSLDEPIKSLGEFGVGVKLHRKVKGQVRVQVVPVEAAG